jgi:hypothetical protein
MLKVEFRVHDSELYACQHVSEEMNEDNNIPGRSMERIHVNVHYVNDQKSSILIAQIYAARRVSSPPK